MRALFCLLLAISLAVGCGGDHEGGPGEGSGQDADSEADAAEGGVADTVVRTDAGSSCTVHVAVSGSDVGECGAPATPCATITAGLERADEGCTVSVGAGTWSSATGESLPIVITDRVHLMLSLIHI